MFLNFFKTPEVRKYEHVNIYYDPDKEEREERRERIRQEVAVEHGLDNGNRVTLRRGFLSEQRKNKVSSSKGNTFLLAFVIAAVIIGLIYLI